MIRNLVGPSPRSKLYTRSQMYSSIIKGLFSRVDRRNLQFDNFSKSIGQFFEVDSKSVVPCSMARVGIYLVLKYFIKNDKREVILSPYTISDVINMVICAGGIPVFCDTEPNTCNIDVTKIEELINSNTAAVMITHFYGLASNIKNAKVICNRNNLPLIEDAAQAFGVKVEGQYVGTFGTAGIFSFGLYKNITSFMGGLIIIKDKNLLESVQLDVNTFKPYSFIDVLPKIVKGAITDLITSPLLFKLFFYKIFRWATLNKIKFINNKFKIDVNPISYGTFPKHYKRQIRQIQTRLIVKQLSNVELNQKIRIANAYKYYEGLKHLSNSFILTPFIDNGSHGYQYYILQVPDRDRLEAYMLSQGCDIMISYHRNCADLNCFHQFFRNCPNARETANSVMYLPTYPDYLEKDIYRNINSIKNFFKSCDA